MLDVEDVPLHARSMTLRLVHRETDLRIVFVSTAAKTTNFTSALITSLSTNWSPRLPMVFLFTSIAICRCAAVVLSESTRSFSIDSSDFGLAYRALGSPLHDHYSIQTRKQYIRFRYGMFECVLPRAPRLTSLGFALIRLRQCSRLKGPDSGMVVCTAQVRSMQVMA